MNILRWVHNCFGYYFEEACLQNNLKRAKIIRMLSFGKLVLDVSLLNNCIRRGNDDIIKWAMSIGIVHEINTDSIRLLIDNNRKEIIIFMIRYNIMYYSIVNKNVLLYCIINNSYDIAENIIYCDRKLINRKSFFNLFSDVCVEGNLDAVKWLYAQKQYFKITRKKNRIFRICCINGHMKILKWLLEIADIDVHSGCDMGFRLACIYNNYNIVEYLLNNYTGFDIHYNCDQAFVGTTDNAIINILVEYSNITMVRLWYLNKVKYVINSDINIPSYARIILSGVNIYSSSIFDTIKLQEYMDNVRRYKSANSIKN